MATSLMIMLIGLSGSGKSTLLDFALSTCPSVKKLISVTTRPPRSKEVDGADKYFFTKEKFEDSRSGLCIINEVYDYYYAFMKDAFMSGDIYIGELHYEFLDDFKRFHNNTVFVYVKPSAINFAISGIKNRGANSEEVERRLDCSLHEHQELDRLYAKGHFDYRFINNFDDQSMVGFVELIKSILQ